MLTPEKIKEMDAILGVTEATRPRASSSRADELRALAKSAPRAPEKKNAYMKVSSAIEDVGVGIVKEGLEQAQGLGKLGLKAAEKIAGKEAGAFGSKETFFKDKTALEKDNTAEKVGGEILKVAQFFLPAGAAARGERTINALTSTLKPLAGGVARVAGKAGIQGLATGGVVAVQTGGDLEKAGKAAVLAGGIRGATAGIGELARAAKIPEKLYSFIYKEGKRGIAKELDSDFFVNLQKSSPEEFKQLVDSGIVTFKGGVPKLNETNAEWALRNKIQGGIGDQYQMVRDRTLASEKQLQEIIKKQKWTVSMKDKRWSENLQKIANKYSGVIGDEGGQVTKEARKFVREIKRNGGVLPADRALELRKFLDGVRKVSSQDKTITELGISEAGLKGMADTIRKTISNRSPKIAELMGDYNQQLKALSALRDVAVKRQSQQLVGLIDSFFIGSALASANPVPIILAAGARRLSTSPAGLTGLAQALQKSTIGTAASGMLGVGAGLQNED